MNELNLDVEQLKVKMGAQEFTLEYPDAKTALEFENKLEKGMDKEADEQLNIYIGYFVSLGMPKETKLRMAHIKAILGELHGAKK